MLEAALNTVSIGYEGANKYKGAGAPFAVDVVELIEAPAAEVIARAQ